MTKWLNWLKKIGKFLLTVCAICILLLVSVNRSSEIVSDMEAKISNISYGGISIKDYYALKESCLEKYFEYIQAEDFEHAYSFLTNQYKRVYTLEKFIDDIKQLNINDIRILEISKRNDEVFLADISINDERHTYLIFVNLINNRFLISPDMFIERVQCNAELSRTDFKFEVIDYTVYTDKVVVNAKFENNMKSYKLNIDNVSIITDSGEVKMDNDKIEVQELGDDSIQLIFNTGYDYPKKVKIYQNLEPKRDITKVYTVNL